MTGVPSEPSWIEDARIVTRDRPEPSYYGPNFQKPPGKRSSSLAGGDIRHPQMPDPFVKRPNPYPPPVEREYNEYKARGHEYSTAQRTAKVANAVANTGRADPQFREKVERAAQAAAGARVAANTTAAYRSGFGHKYPYANETPKKVIDHHKEAYTYKEAGAAWRVKEQKQRKKL
ncbi:hypothetical protein CNMCM5793_000732 [Aspergillus hiratsukae]|uniref:Uncharacterized protein n=1 Tax=Aspergillus hiratsukae TaxID=1194566 RepID=A0A8H6P1Z9_9EURO|nr:hypothetical protein CNMCM5793_000732 [Aspergillus hiratsukae]